MFWKGTLLAEPREKPAHSHHPLLYTSPLTDTNLYSFHPPRHLLPSLILSSVSPIPSFFFSIPAFWRFIFFFPHRPPHPPRASFSPSPLAAICRIVHLVQSVRAHCLSNAWPPRTLRGGSARGRARIDPGRARVCVHVWILLCRVQVYVFFSAFRTHLNRVCNRAATSLLWHILDEASKDFWKYLQKKKKNLPQETSQPIKFFIAKAILDFSHF